jgi:EAL domain-containing protein (putative c-di-GMP-specific phosphodiesterase class I)
MEKEISKDRQWVKDFGASDKSQAVYELAAWLDSLGLKLTVENVEKVDR